MRKLSEIQGEESIEVLGEIIDNGAAIFEDNKVQELARKSSYKRLAVHICKNHKKEVSEILLAVDDTPINALNLLQRTVELLVEIGSTPELIDFFGLQGQNEAEESSGSAMENTEESER